MNSRHAVRPSQALEQRVCRATGARAVGHVERLQSLWSGYGEIARIELIDGPLPTVVVKWVTPPEAGRHPRGWATSRSHERKLRSYEVERHFYESYASACDSSCRIPRALACEQGGEGEGDGRFLFVLEDIDVAGFPDRRHHLSEADLHDCLVWLAHFHARFLGVTPDGLWPVGTYWHLATRPDELRAMEDEELRRAAVGLDAALNGCRYQTLVHGDAKVENFCFGRPSDFGASSDSATRASEPSNPLLPSRVAAVDFQYVGGGCGMKDVAYFFSSCLDEDDCACRAEGLLDIYFAELRRAVTARTELGVSVDVDELEHEWRALYPVAWADFFRFLQGWAPGHYKIHSYSRQMTRLALQRLVALA